MIDKVTPEEAKAVLDMMVICKRFGYIKTIARLQTAWANSLLVPGFVVNHGVYAAKKAVIV